MNNKTCLITGGNSGIGKQAAIQLMNSGFHVIVSVRNLERGEKALEEIKNTTGKSNIELLHMDLSSKASIYKASEELHKRFEKLDVIIHNAADFDIAQENVVKSEDGIEKIWATNHIGPILFTNSVMDLLKASIQGRIITIASQGLVMHPKLEVDLKDPEFENRKFSVSKAYYQSKLAQVMYTYWLAKELQNTSITANCIRVTNVKVDINRYPNISGFMKLVYSLKSRFSISPDEMAKTYTYLASSPILDNTSGKYFNEKNQMVKSSPYSIEEENIKALMNLTMKYLSDM